MADDVNIRFGASIDDFKAKLGQITEFMKGFADGAQEEIAGRAASAFGIFGKDAERVAQNVAASYKTLPPALAAVGVAVLALGAIIGGGLFAKNMADNNAEMIESTRDFARAMGITTNEASVYRAAIEDVGASQGEFEGASRGLARQLKTNEEGLKKLGLETRNEAGEKKNNAQLTLEAIAILNTYKEGQDRMAVSQVMFGRGLSASSRLMLMNKDDVEKLRVQMEALGLIVGDKAVTGYKEYDDAADQASRTQQGFAKAIQEAVLPVALELTQWFNNVGPVAISVFSSALASLGTVFVLLTNGVRVVWETFKAFFVSIAEPLRAITEAMGRAMVGDMAGAGAQLRGISGTVSGAWESAFAKMTDSSQKTKDRIERMWTGGVDKKPGDSGSAPGGKDAPDFAKEREAEKEAERARKKAEKDAERAAKEAAREREKAAEAMFRVQQAAGAVALNIQREDLKAEATANEEAYRNNLISLDAYYDEKLRIELAGINASRDAKLAELANANTKVSGAESESERLKFAAEAIKLQGEVVVLTRQEGEAVLANGRARIAAQQALQDQLEGIRATSARAATDAEIDIERGAIAQQAALRLIDNEQAIAAQIALEQRSYAATQRFLASKRALLNAGDQQGNAAQLAAEEQAYREHTRRMIEIDRSLQLERARDSIQAQQTIQGNFATMVNSVLNGTQTIGNAFREFGRSVANVFTNLIAQRFTERLFNATGVNKLIDGMVNFITEGLGKMLFQWTATQIAMTSATAAGTAARDTIEQASSAQSIATWAMTAVKNIAAAAWQAAASVYAAVAAIPVVGWILAPALAIAAGAAVLGFASRIVSSAGGDVQVDQDRLNFVHKDETIIPARFAGGLRELINGGGPAIGVGGSALPTALPSGMLGRSPSAGITAGSAAPGMAGGAGRGGGARPVNLVGASAGEFFIANKQQLQKALDSLHRDFSGRRR